MYVHLYAHIRRCPELKKKYPICLETSTEVIIEVGNVSYRYKNALNELEFCFCHQIIL